MKGLRLNKVLGLAIGDRSILAAEVAGGGEPEVRRTGEFVWPEGVSLEQPDVLGKALGQFLKQQRFSANQAVVGLPAKWVLVKPKEVPPADDDAAASLLRLQAEREFSPELKDLVYDFAGQTSASEPTSVLLMATPQKYLDQIQAMAEAARITVRAVAPWAAALGEASGKVLATNAAVMYLGAGSAELTARSGGGLCVLRHLRPTAVPVMAVAERVRQGGGGEAEESHGEGANGSNGGNGGGRVADGALLGFSGELRRVLSMLPPDRGPGAKANGTNGSNGHNGGRELVVWDGIGVDPSALVALSERLGVTVKAGRELARRAGDVASGAQHGVGRFAPAVALCVAGIQDGLLPVDFLHSRLTAPKKQLVGRQAAWAIAVAVALAVSSVLFYSDLQEKARERDDLLKTLNSQKADAAAAKAAVDRVTLARSWYGGQPKYLECFKDLTNSVPEDSGTWMMSLNIREAPKVQAVGARPGAGAAASAAPDKTVLQVNISGKSTNEKIPLRIQDALLGANARLGAKRITDVRLQNVRVQQNKGVKETNFDITFNYLAD